MVFFVSDHTGITVETMGHSLLSQFAGVEFDCHTIPFVNDPGKAHSVAQSIQYAFAKEDLAPIVFSSLTDPALREIVRESGAVVFDFFDSFIADLEKTLQSPVTRGRGKVHGMLDNPRYFRRIESVNFALGHDDGLNTSGYSQADIIAVGVSRTGKTPVCLYLALQYSVNAANYPFTDRELDSLKLPERLRAHRERLFGLTIEPAHLSRIRQERRPNSRYATLKQCQKELSAIEELFFRENIPFTNTSNASVEEISTTIMQRTELDRHKI